MSMAYIGAVVAVGALTTSVVQGEKQRKASRRQFEAEQTAQRQAERQQIGSDRLAAQDQRRGQKKRSGSEQYMAQAATAGSRGPMSTLLTGAGGARSLLGGRGTMV